MAKGVQKRHVQVATAILVIALLAGFTLWLAPWPSNCKRAARPLIDALERYHKIYGCYPNSLGQLIREKLIRAIPEPRWSFDARRIGVFDYYAEPDLDFYCLGYAECPMFATHWEEVSYVSFRGAWDDTPGVPSTEWHRLPIERAGELFQESRSSSHLRFLIKKVLEYRRHGGLNNPWELYWEDIAKAVGSVIPCTLDGGAGFCVEADDHEGAAFGFLINPVQSAFWDKHEVMLISERDMEGDNARWREVFRTATSPVLR
jgi:hypothetical protein